MTEQDPPQNTSFNEDFCAHLEHRLGSALKNSGRPELSGFWCDGVSHDAVPDSRLSKKHVGDTRQIATRAWIGKDGQDVYEMTIRLGKQALSRYAKGTAMIDCIPDAGSMDWIDIDTKRKEIEIRLT
ncbi:MAG: hypothetical protein H6575_12315 [Lewinellaceae bacterium]|nr:hypothetical protein [Lewinellaceae bacterium]